MCSIASWHLLIPNLCGGIKENLTSSWPTALMLEEELIQLTIHNFSKNEIIALVKNFMKYKLCCFLEELNQVYYEKFIGVVKFISEHVIVKNSRKAFTSLFSGTSKDFNSSPI